MKAEVITKLEELRACGDAIQWVKHKRNIQTAWQNCERGDWMFWLIGETIAGEPWSDERKPLVLAACGCARLALKYVPKDEKRPLTAVETAEGWAKGEDISEKDVKNTAEAAYATYVTYAAYAAYDAAHAAHAAYDAAYATADAASAVDAAEVGYAVKKKTLKKYANIVRKYYPDPPKLI